MNKINKVLNEEIKSKILESLMKKDNSFSELLEITGLKDHGQLNYHLRSMLNEKLIEKKNEKYTKTPLGERMGVYIKQFQSKEMYPVSVVCAIIRNEKGEILALKRAKSPQKGRWGFPGGKTTIGEKISETAEREVFEETGLKTEFDKVLGFFPSIVYNENQLSYHANVIPVLMKDISSKSEVKIDKNEHDDFQFIKVENLKKLKLVGNNLDILKVTKDLTQTNFSFREFIYKE